MNLLNVAPAQARRELEELMNSSGQPAYRVGQVMSWIWEHPIPSWSEATNLPAEMRDLLEFRSPFPRLKMLDRQDSGDGTVKFLWGLPAGGSVESVLIPEGRRRTLCISSQVGCAFGCRFCATGTMGFGRHLEPWEIVAQVREMRFHDSAPITNVVYMGMGEPLHNWEGVSESLTILNDPSGAGIGARHITVSTVGIVPRLKDLAARPEQFTVAVSLHASNTATRANLMPIEKRYPIPVLMDALEVFSRRVTFEYVMIEGINDSRQNARELSALARRLSAHVNLLPLHPGGAPDLRPSSDASVQAFADQLRSAGVGTTVRRSRGLDIKAACGQLRVDFERRTVQPEHDRDVE